MTGLRTLGSHFCPLGARSSTATFLGEKGRYERYCQDVSDWEIDGRVLAAPQLLSEDTMPISENLEPYNGFFSRVVAKADGVSQGRLGVRVGLPVNMRHVTAIVGFIQTTPSTLRVRLQSWEGSDPIKVWHELPRRLAYLSCEHRLSHVGDRVWPPEQSEGAPRLTPRTGPVVATANDLPTIRR